MKKLEQRQPESGPLAQEDASFALKLVEELSRTSTFEELVTTILLRLQHCFSAERSALFLLGKQRLFLTAFASPSPPETEFSTGKLPADDSLPGMVSRSGTPTIAGRDSLEPRLVKQLEELLSGRLDSVLCTPLCEEDGNFGAFCAINKQWGKEFSGRDSTFSSAIAFPISLALRLFRHKNELRKSVLQREMLAEVGRAVGSSLDLQAVLSSTLDALHRVLQYDAAGIFLLRPRTLEIHRLAIRGWDAKAEDKVRLKVGEGLIGWAIKTGSGIIVPDTRKDPRYVEARASSRSSIASPLIVADRVIGAFGIESDRVSAFTEDHLDLLTAFANQVAIMIDRTRLHEEVIDKHRIEDQLEIARQIQSSFLPSGCPVLDEFEMCGVNLPFEEVGGDYYDFIHIVEHQIGIAIADVSGKGIPASLIMASFRASLLAEIRNNYAIRTILTKANSLLYESIESGRFVTAFYGVLDTKKKVLTFSNAGHNPPILMRVNGEKELLSEGGIVLGVLPDATYEERSVTLSSGDVLVLYTDGVTEAANLSGEEEFGQDRLEELVRSSLHMGTREIADRIIDEVASFRGRAKQNDDLTLMVVKAR